MTLTVDEGGWSPAACHCGTVRFRVRLSDGLARLASDLPLFAARSLRTWKR